MAKNRLWQFFMKLSFKSKLWFIIGVQFLAIFMITVLSVSNINQATQLIKRIHRDSFDSSNLILNADRDLYQALNDFQNTHDVKSQDYLDNLNQVRERVSEARTILEQDQSRWDKYNLDGSRKTVFNVFDDFFQEFDLWIDINQRSNRFNEQSKTQFEKMRGNINTLGELIKGSADQEIEQIMAQKEAMVIKLIITDTVICLFILLCVLVVLKMITTSLKSLTEASEALAIGNVDITVDSVSNDEIGRLADSFNVMIKNTRTQALTAEKLAAGDLEVDIKPRSDKDILSNSMLMMIDSLKNLVSETDSLTNAAIEGRLNNRGNADKFQGGYRAIITGVNQTLDAIIEPVKEASSVLQEMAKGNLQVSVRGRYQGDHAEIKDALNLTIESLQGYVGEISNVLTEMSNGNLEVVITSDYRGDFVNIKNSLNHVIQSFNEILGELNNAAVQVAAGSRQVSDSSQALSQGSAEQASTVQEITASVTQIAAQTRQNAANASQANELALGAKTKAVEGNAQMAEMLKAMDEINQSSANISKIIKVIDEIAFQTNILALNAAVEAARAGQHGKGFAVVAEEVRNLAARSANAAKETTGMIEGSIKKVEIGTKIANDTATALNQIVDGVTRTTELVGEIAVASNEQATGISQINQGISQVSQVTQNNTATAEQSAAASEELSSQAMMLRSMVGKFRIKNGQLIADLNPVQEKSFKPSTKSSKGNIILNDFDFAKY